MMSISLFVFLVVLTSTLYLTRVQTKKPLPVFSDLASGTFKRKYSLTVGKEEDIHYYKVDVKNQKAWTKITTMDGKVIGEHWLIWVPPGAPAGTEASKGYVFFTMTDPNPNDNDDSQFCSYLTNTKINFGSGHNYAPEVWPDHWDRHNTIEIKQWVEVDSELVYQGVESDGTNRYDVWSSSYLCSSGEFGSLPCNKIATIENTNYPSAEFYVSEATGQSFRNSWWYDDTYLSYEENTEDIKPPLNWWTSCYNQNNGFHLDPFGRGFVSTPTDNDKFQLSLSTLPVWELGTVKVYFMFAQHSCLDCIAFINAADGKPIDYLQFNKDNWKNPVSVIIQYLKEGESYFYIIGEGGGYDIPNWFSYFTETGAKTVSHGHRVLTCNGVVGYGCDD